jgi:hypothetical protein
MSGSRLTPADRFLIGAKLVACLLGLVCCGAIGLFLVLGSDNSRDCAGQTRALSDPCAVDVRTGEHLSVGQFHQRNTRGMHVAGWFFLAFAGVAGFAGLRMVRTAVLRGREARTG